MHLSCGGWEYKNCPIYKDPERSFAELWDSTHKPEESFEANPYVWVYGVEVKEATR
jgi:hypothetical protein